MLIPAVTTGQHNGFTFRLGIVHKGLMASNHYFIYALVCRRKRTKNGGKRHKLQTIAAFQYSGRISENSAFVRSSFVHKSFIVSKPAKIFHSSTIKGASCITARYFYRSFLTVILYSDISVFDINF